MTIADVELIPFDVRRRYATQIAQEGGGAREVVEASPFLFIRATTDSGLVGWGEISDIEPDEVPDLEHWRQQVASSLIGRDPVDIARHHDEWAKSLPDPEDPRGSSLNRLTRAGLDMTCYDLASQSTNLPVCRLLGGQWRDRIHISWVAFIRDDLQLLRDEISEKCAEIHGVQAESRCRHRPGRTATGRDAGDGRTRREHQDRSQRGLGPRPGGDPHSTAGPI